MKKFNAGDQFVLNEQGKIKLQEQLVTRSPEDTFLLRALMNGEVFVVDEGYEEVVRFTNHYSPRKTHYIISTQLIDIYNAPAENAMLDMLN